MVMSDRVAARWMTCGACLQIKLWVCEYRLHCDVKARRNIVDLALIRQALSCDCKRDIEGICFHFTFPDRSWCLHPGRRVNLFVGDVVAWLRPQRVHGATVAAPQQSLDFRAYYYPRCGCALGHCASLCRGTDTVHSDVGGPYHTADMRLGAVAQEERASTVSPESDKQKLRGSLNRRFFHAPY